MSYFSQNSPFKKKLKNQKASEANPPRSKIDTDPALRGVRVISDRGTTKTPPARPSNPA